MNQIEKIKKESQEIRKELKKRTFSYMTAGIGLIAGLAWNDAIKSFIEYFFPVAQNTMLAKFLYAVIITIALVIFSYYLGKILTADSKEEKK